MADRPAAPVEVRLVGEESAPLWREIRLRALQTDPAAFGSTYEREVAFTEEDWRARGGPDVATVLGLADGRPVAMGGAFVEAQGWCHVVAMWVDPAWRGQGIGHRVLDRIVTWGRERALRVHLDVEVDNDSARRLYAGYGFVATGETRPLREGSPLRVVRMVLPRM